MAKLPVMALKEVIMVIPREAKERATLEKDLRQMGCHGLMQRLWALKYDKIVAELLVALDNGWAGIVR